MGASNSKQEPLQDKLVKDTAAPSAKVRELPAAGTQSVNSRDLSDAVEKEVAKELERILEKQQHDQLRAKERQSSTAELLSEIRELSQQINAGPAAQSPSFAEAVDARNRAAQCLRNNEGRALDCWKEVSTFKSLVAGLQREFVASN
ncbi:hypothetical protein IWW36_004449 [Coemansia brasiliensis]|uniref:Uncharacterized protein n=1 Tax=Coemansia brasiliensis TaxID=2650707 RepID=A0A9W8LYS3_9FUNG|nr:hypothetical protein IWW36_004449 [Coemansia brasiliensis]